MTYLTTTGNIQMNSGSTKSQEYYRGLSDATRFSGVASVANVELTLTVDYDGGGRVILPNVSEDYVQGLSDGGLVSHNPENFS